MGILRAAAVMMWKELLGSRFYTDCRMNVSGNGTNVVLDWKREEILIRRNTTFFWAGDG